MLPHDRKLYVLLLQRISKHFAGFYHSWGCRQRLAHRAAQIRAVLILPGLGCSVPTLPALGTQLRTVWPVARIPFFLYEILVTKKSKELRCFEAGTAVIVSSGLFSEKTQHFPWPCVHNQAPFAPQRAEPVYEGQVCGFWSCLGSLRPLHVFN